MLSDNTTGLSLSALLNESAQQNLGDGGPVAFTQMSLLDLMNPLPSNSGALDELDLSTPAPCSKDIAQIPDLMRIGHSSTSLSVEMSKDVAASSLHGSQETSFPRYIRPEKLEKASLFGSLSSVLHSEDSMSSDGENLSVPKYGSPSLADLILEHKERNPLQDLVIDSPQKNRYNTDGQTGCFVPLSQLCDGPNAAFDIPSLTTSLSSLAVSQSTDQGAFQVSLSDLIAETNNKPLDDVHDLFPSGGVTLTETDTNIDLRFLISEPLIGLNSSSLNTKPATPEPLDPKASCDKSIRSVKMLVSKNRKKPGHWVKPLRAKPSTFALSLCFTYIPKACRKSLLVTQPSYCQNSECERTDHTSHPEIMPFDFHTPSPDDLVKEHQKKAFMR